eukprot:6365143-Pyramimonas_sp.AAC.1
MRRGRHANFATGAFGGAPDGATKRVRSAPKWVLGHRANPASGAFGGALPGAPKHVRGVPEWGGAAMRTLPLGPSVEPPMRPRNV